LRIDMSELRKINYEQIIGGDQLLNFVTVERIAPMARKNVVEYCADKDIIKLASPGICAGRALERCS
jgi:hypothetical protein